MSYFLWQRHTQIAIAVNRRVLRADEVPSLLQANALCRELEARLTAQPLALEAALSQAHQQGYAAGLNEGRAIADEEAGARHGALTDAMNATRDQLASDLASLAVAVISRLMGEFGPAERIAGMAMTAAQDAIASREREHETIEPFTLVVNPQRIQAVRDHLASLNSAPALCRLVRADADCPPETCRLESASGCIDASLEVQLERLAHAWQSKAVAQ